MLRIENVTKKYDGQPAIENISFSVKKGTACGVVGYNGAGKTTLLKTICGALIPDAGGAALDGLPVFSSAEARARVFFVPDNPYWLPQSNMAQMRKFYAGYYQGFDGHGFGRLLEIFGLDAGKRLSGFSKGMQRQAALVFALSSGAEYLLLDELFDGLDPQMLELAIKLLQTYIKQRGAAVVLASHNLPKVGQLCGQVVLLDGRRLAFDRDVGEMLAERSPMTFEEIVLAEIAPRGGVFEGLFSETGAG